MRGAAIGAVVGVSSLGLILSLTTPPVRAQLKPDSVETPFGRAPLTFADIVDKVKPAVVSISVVNGQPRVARNNAPTPKGGPRSPRGETFPDLPDDHPLNEFFKNMPRGGQNPVPRPSQAQGSGFVISPDGYVVTNNHVIDGGGKIQVSFDQKNKYDAELVGSDARTDLALLKVKADQPLPFVKFAAKPARVGDWVLAVGNPFGLGGTVTAGIVSALARDIGSGPYDYIQIDAAVNRGNSGGPTFNLAGEVIGVNTAIYSPSGGNVGIAFAVPAGTVNEVVTQLRSSGSVSRGWLGVKIQTIDEDTAAGLGLSDAKGALINEVTSGGPAAAAGLKTQDAILSVNGEAIADSRDLARKIAEFSPNTSVDVRILRAGREQTVKVKLGQFPGSREEIARLEQGPSPADNEVGSLGLAFAPSRGGKAAGGGVTISEVDGSSDAATKGLKAGDVVLEVNSQPVASSEEVEAAVKKAKDMGRRAVLLSVKSADQQRVVAVQIKKG
jgi:serine protease Do